jgi:hypothetical protein
MGRKLAVAVSWPWIDPEVFNRVHVPTSLTEFCIKLRYSLGWGPCVSHNLRRNPANGKMSRAVKGGRPLVSDRICKGSGPSAPTALDGRVLSAKTSPAHIEACRGKTDSVSDQTDYRDSFGGHVRDEPGRWFLAVRASSGLHPNLTFNWSTLRHSRLVYTKRS